MARQRSRPREPLLLLSSGKASPLSTREPTDLSSRVSHQTNILIVEDSALVIDALRVLLEEHGYAVAVADSLHSARIAYARFKPHVVLLDVVLPDGDGLSLAREWLDGGDGHRSQVLALTGHADDETRLRCLAAGCRDVLIKPVPSTELIQRIAGVTS